MLLTLTLLLPANAGRKTPLCKKFTEHIAEGYPASVEIRWLEEHRPLLTEEDLDCFSESELPVDLIAAARQLLLRQQDPLSAEELLTLDDLPGEPLADQIARALAQTVRLRSQNWEASFAIHIDCDFTPPAGRGGCDGEGVEELDWLHLDEVSHRLRKALPGDSRYTEDPEVLGTRAASVLSDPALQEELLVGGFAWLLSIRLHGVRDSLTAEYRLIRLGRSTEAHTGTLSFQYLNWQAPPPPPVVIALPVTPPEPRPEPEPHQRLWTSLDPISPGLGQVRLYQSGHALSPQWSTDGRRLTIELNTMSGQRELLLIDGRSGQARSINIPGMSSAFSRAGEWLSGAVWVSGWEYLLFNGSSITGQERIYFTEPDGQAPAELLTPGQLAGSLAVGDIHAQADGLSHSLVLTSDATGNGDLYLWTAGSGTIQQIVSSPFSEHSPRWNEAGDTLAYARRNQGGDDLFIWKDGQITPRVGGNGDQTRPRWAGESILFFTSERGEGHWDVAVSEGAGQKRILAKDVRLPSSGPPVLTPDGWLAVVPEDSADTILIVSLDGSWRHRLSIGLSSINDLAFIRQGERDLLAFTALPHTGAGWRGVYIAELRPDKRGYSGVSPAAFPDLPLAPAQEPTSPPPPRRSLTEAELVELRGFEAPAREGVLHPAQIDHLEGLLQNASPVGASLISRLLMRNAREQGDTATWERLVKRHLEEIDRSDPDLLLLYARHLSPGGVQQAPAVIRWTSLALERSDQWSGAERVERVSELHRLRTEAAMSLWESTTRRYVETHQDEDEASANRYRALAQQYAISWLDFAWAAGARIDAPRSACRAAAGQTDGPCSRDPRTNGK